MAFHYNVSFIFSRPFHPFVTLKRHALSLSRPFPNPGETESPLNPFSECDRWNARCKFTSMITWLPIKDDRGARVLGDLLVIDPLILNNGQVTKTTPELGLPLQASMSRQHEEPRQI
ncbi:hypothetical protein TNCV_5096431 [Trichonephila clavipes]|nr:hypothetical protein TNCV_5096431 [Trichonephila clavipes]